MQLAKHSSKEILSLQNPYMTCGKNQKQFLHCKQYLIIVLRRWGDLCRRNIAKENVFKLLGDKLFSSSILLTQFEPYENK